MLIISHRVNTITDLINTPLNYGIEVDLRDFNENIILAHDPFTDGVQLMSFLKFYNHSFIILNIKSERIEYKVLEIIKLYNIKNYFFLDSSIPMINNLIKLPGGVGDRAPSDQIDPIQLSTGIQIEMEHTNDPEIAKEISETTGFATTNKAAMLLLPKEIQNNLTIYPSKEILDQGSSTMKHNQMSIFEFDPYFA